MNNLQRLASHAWEGQDEGLAQLGINPKPLTNIDRHFRRKLRPRYDYRFRGVACAYGHSHSLVARGTTFRSSFLRDFFYDGSGHASFFSENR
jgi:hypothetical protein